MKKEGSYHAVTSNAGSASFTIHLDPDKPLTHAHLCAYLADTTEQVYRFMLEKNYVPKQLPHDVGFKTPQDIAKEHGSTRQYWEKLFKEGKIPYRATSAGKISTHIWVNAYLKNKKEIDAYTLCLRSLRNTIEKTDRWKGHILCPHCRTPESFSFHHNKTSHHISGFCSNIECRFSVQSASV